MKYKEDRPLAKLDVAVSKLLAIANGMEPDHAGRLQVGAINEQFLGAGGNVHEYMAAVKAAIAVARVRLFTRNGHDWTGRYPLMIEAAADPGRDIHRGRRMLKRDE